MTIDPKNLSATATLTFGDEFNNLSLWNGTSGTWSTKYAYAPAKGSTLAGNGEQEWYINAMYAPTTSVKPWTVSGGVLTLTAAPASSSIQPLIDGYQYTSGMINTYNSFSQKYGYFEMRAQLPAGQGLWPAFWLLQVDGSWPPEIDAMEVLGHDMTTLYTAAHTNQTGTHTSQGGTIKVPNMSQGYHTYGVDWQANYITYYFDGAEVWKTATPSDMNEPMYMIANLAVGGYWPGMVNSTTPFPAQMKIDYIRAYADAGVVVPPPTTPPPTTPPPTTPPPTTPPPTVPPPAASGKLFTLPTSGAGIDTVSTAASSFALGAGQENLTLVGSSGQTGVGNALNNILKSNNYGSTLNGGDGNDILVVGRSSDVLTGGAGSDIFEFNNLPWNGARITDFKAGTDMLDLRPLFSAAHYQGTNPVADGYLTFASNGAGGTKVLFDPDGKAAGNPWPFQIATLDNVAPSSLHAQSEWFYNGTAGSTPSTPPPTTPPPVTPPPASSSKLFTLPTSGSGIDTASTTASSYTAPSGIENVILGGSASQAVTGNSLSNIITSNNYGSRIDAGAGNDIIIVGRSWDVLTGGAGSDIFQFNKLPWNSARITDFTVGTDMLDLRPLFAAANYQGTNPVADGYLSFAADGAGGTKIYFDPDGKGSANPWPFQIATVDHVVPSGLHMQTEWFFH